MKSWTRNEIRRAAPLILLAGLTACATTHPGGSRLKEKDYQNPWCAQMGGITEVVLDDKTRVDCLTEEFAIEVDFAPKWAEAVGQSLYYAEQTGRRPGILLIMLKPTDARHLDRLQLLGNRHGITTWTIDQGSL